MPISPGDQRRDLIEVSMRVTITVSSLRMKSRSVASSARPSRVVPVIFSERMIPRAASIDTSTAAGKCFLDMLGVFAEFETNLRRERQMEGIAGAKTAGVYRGRRPSDVQAVRELKEQGVGTTAIAKRLKIGRASVYRVLGGREPSPRAT